MFKFCVSELSCVFQVTSVVQMLLWCKSFSVYSSEYISQKADCHRWAHTLFHFPCTFPPSHVCIHYPTLLPLFSPSVSFIHPFLLFAVVSQSYLFSRFHLILLVTTAQWHCTKKLTDFQLHLSTSPSFTLDQSLSDALLDLYTCFSTSPTSSCLFVLLLYCSLFPCKSSIYFFLNLVLSLRVCVCVWSVSRLLAWS